MVKKKLVPIGIIGVILLILGITFILIRLGAILLNQSFPDNNFLIFSTSLLFIFVGIFMLFFWYGLPFKRLLK